VSRQAAVAIEGEPDGSTVLLTRADAGAFWSIWATLPRADLLHLAESLRCAPGGAMVGPAA
jgi:hypothetical protein